MTRIDWMIIMMGLAMVAFWWFTNPKKDDSEQSTSDK